jgi:hypothetical protein
MQKPIKYADVGTRVNPPKIIQSRLLPETWVNREVYEKLMAKAVKNRISLSGVIVDVIDRYFSASSESTESSFIVGDKVSWTSQAGGFSKKKEGIVAEVVPAGSYPNREKFLSLYKSQGIGTSRKMESYVVIVGNQPYWPIVKNLSLVSN